MTVVGSGLGAQLAAAEETTYGTAVTPTHFPDMVDESIKAQITTFNSKSLGAGSLVEKKGRRIVRRTGAGGDIDFELTTRGAGLWLKHGLGAVAIATAPGGTTSKKMTFTLGADPGSLTVQAQRPSSDGTLNAFTYAGSIVTASQFECDLDGVLTLKSTLSAQSEDTAFALAAATAQPVSDVFTWDLATVTVNGATVDNVTKFSLKYDKSVNDNRRFLGKNFGAKRKKPIRNGFGDLSGSLDVEFDSMTNYNLFTAGVPFALTLKFEGPTAIEASVIPSITFTLPAVQFDGDTPTVGGPDILSASMPFTVLDDLVDAPVTIDYITLDTVV